MARTILRDGVPLNDPLELLDIGREQARRVHTPWGEARSLTMEEVHRLRAGRGGMTWAEMCVLFFDLNEASGMEPRRAMDRAILETAEIKFEQDLQREKGTD